MIFLSLIAVAIAVALVWSSWETAECADRSLDKRWLRDWAIKGLAGPILIWLFVNSGLFAWFPPIMPQVAEAATVGAKLEALQEVVTRALLVVSSFWAAGTLAWILTIVETRAKPRSDFFAYVGAWSLFLLPVATLIVYGLGWWGAGLAVTVWFWPITRSVLPLAIHEAPAPTYSRAVAKAMFGKYQEAEWEVIKELEKSENDFDGWLLLADLYANNFHDLATAERTIYDLCDQPDMTPSNISVALHRLADWHLKLGKDPVPARRALEEIIRRLPGTHLARMARLRLNQLPVNREEMAEQRQGRRIALPPLCEDLDSVAVSDQPVLSTEAAAAKAHAYVEALKRDPDDASAREAFARVLADSLQQPDLAIQQLKLLLDMPDQAPTQVAEWLGLLAAWQIKYRHDPPAAKPILTRLVQEFPHSPQAFAAQRRLKLMEMDERLRRAGRGTGTLRIVQ
jgi:hypothetical protein